VRPVEYAASVLPGLEEIAGEEIEARLAHSRILKTQRGWVLFHYPGHAADLLRLRTTEDVFVVLFRTGELPSRRKEALPLLTRMARNSHHWHQAMASFGQVGRGKVKRVTFRVVAQMSGRHGFRRQEARDAVLSGVQARWTGWKPVADDAHLEVWISLVGSWALIAIRLSKRSMRHRTYKQEHRPAALRPTLAAAMVALTQPRPSDRVCDPMCGTGTLLAERKLVGPCRALLGGDIAPDALVAAAANLSRTGIEGGEYTLQLWDARQLPLRACWLDVIVCNLPFGEQIGSHEDNPALYDLFFRQVNRVLRPGGRAVLLTSEKELVRELLPRYPHLRREREVLVGVLGQAARIYVLLKT
jgi:23S rRNA G2445 N2-methylase RlmL